MANSTKAIDLNASYNFILGEVTDIEGLGGLQPSDGVHMLTVKSLVLIQKDKSIQFETVFEVTATISGDDSTKKTFTEWFTLPSQSMKDKGVYAAQKNQRLLQAFGVKQGGVFENQTLGNIQAWLQQALVGKSGACRYFPYIKGENGAASVDNDAWFFLADGTVVDGQPTHELADYQAGTLKVTRRVSTRPQQGAVTGNSAAGTSIALAAMGGMGSGILPAGIGANLLPTGVGGASGLPSGLNVGSGANQPAGLNAGTAGFAGLPAFPQA